MGRTLLPRTAPAALLQGPVRLLARLGVTPNMVTVAGFLGNAGAAVLAARGAWLAAGVVMLLASALDLLDGALARATGRATAFGAIFDAVLDRYSEVAVLLALLVYFEGRDGVLQFWLIGAAVTGSVLVSYVRALAETMGGRLREGLFTRVERVVLVAAALIVGEWWPPAVTGALWLLAVLSTLTALQRVWYLARLSLAEQPS